MKVGGGQRSTGGRWDVLAGTVPTDESDKTIESRSRHDISRSETKSSQVQLRNMDNELSWPSPIEAPTGGNELAEHVTPICTVTRITDQSSDANPRASDRCIDSKLATVKDPDGRLLSVSSRFSYAQRTRRVKLTAEVSSTVLYPLPLATVGAANTAMEPRLLPFEQNRAET